MNFIHNLAVIDRPSHYQQLDLNLLKLFEALYQEQNMSKVAERLHLTPSAVSHGIKRLRQSMGDSLFIRRGQIMVPSPLAQRLAPQLLDNLARLRQLLNIATDFNPLTSRQEFRVGLHGALEPILLPKLVSALYQCAPGVRVHSVRMNRDNLTSELAAGHIDCAVDVALPLRAPIHHTALSTDRFVVLYDKQQIQGPINAEDYLQHQHIAVSTRSSGAVVEDVILQQMGFSRQVHLRCQSYPGAISCVPTSRLMLTMPALLLPDSLPAALMCQDLPLEISAPHTHLYWHEHTHVDKAMVWFRHQLMSVMTRT